MEEDPVVLDFTPTAAKEPGHADLVRRVAAAGGTVRKTLSTSVTHLVALASDVAGKRVPAMVTHARSLALPVVTHGRAPSPW